MQHFLKISQLSRNEIDILLTRAKEFKYQGHYPHYPHHTLATLFYENSTRTRVSFELAAKHLSMPVINVNLSHSSESKGETLEDTIATITAMGITHIAIRHQEDGLPEKLANQLGDNIHIINAGDGQHAHPSQAMLDLMTITEQKPDLSRLKIAILGNIRHSRVANSLQCLFKTMNLGEFVLIAPTLWHPKTLHYGRVTTDIDEGLANADVIICLRVQNERLGAHEALSPDDYKKHYTLTKSRLALAKPDAMILHPGPVNRGMEIESDLADGPQSFILEQVKNGVFMRMAILEMLQAV
jgi:aspartate carbamoyltransferase catalytic subunit